MYFYRLFNSAELKTEGDTRSDGSIAKLWRLCIVQQLEGLKTLVRIFPIWSTGIFLSIPVEMRGSMTILQALTMDRHLGPHFKIPTGSMVVIPTISAVISLTLIDRFLCPLWLKLSRQSLTPLERVGVGHILNSLSMIVSAIVESKRLKIAHHLKHQPDSTVPMLVFWLFPPLVLGGIAEEFHFPGQIAFYYQEFPVSLRSTAIAIASVTIGIAYYLSTAMVDLIKRVTGWLPDDINYGRPDNVYWMQAVVRVLNFGYYLVCT